MHIGDFYWALRMLSSNNPLADTRIWPRAAGSLSAFAWLDPPEFADLIVDPAATPGTLDEALDWLEAESRAQARSLMTVVVVDGDESRTHELRRRGYAPGEGGNTRLWQQLVSAPKAEVVLPSGFSLGHVSSERDIERRAFVEASSFGNSTINADAWLVLRQRLPQYQEELDLIAVAPDGNGASACTCWYDESTRVGEFEAVGTSAPYRRHGLGRAVITEGLRRLQRLGATRAVVQTMITNAPAIALYQSCGFEIVGHDYAWTKPL